MSENKNVLMKVLVSVKEYIGEKFETTSWFELACKPEKLKETLDMLSKYTQDFIKENGIRE